MSGDAAVDLPGGRPDRLGPLLERRRSDRRFGAALELAEVASLLWAGYGRRRDGGGVAPSAHALHRLAVSVVVGEVEDLAPGAFVYSPTGHALLPGLAGDHRVSVAETTLVDAEWASRAAALLVITAELDVLNEQFAEQPPRGRRGERYAWLEAGHVSQNIYLAAADLELAAVLVAGFDDDALADCLRDPVPDLPSDSRAMGIVAVGRQPDPPV